MDECYLLLDCELNLSTFRLLRFSSSSSFALSGTNGSISVWDSSTGNRILSSKLESQASIITVINRELVAVCPGGKIYFLNGSLQIKRQIDGSNRTSPQSIAGNSKFLAYGDNEGAVRFYNHDGLSREMVSCLFFYY